MLTTQDLKPSLPPLPCLSSSRPPIAQFFPQASNPNLTLTNDNPATHDAIIDADGKSDVIPKAEKRHLLPAPTEEEKRLSKKLSNPFMPAGEPESDSEWDESFEAFAAGRLQSPEDMTGDCKLQQNTSSDHPLEHRNNKRALLPMTDADQSTNVNDTLHPQPFKEFVFEAHKVISKHHLDTFAQMLETIPEHLSFESDNLTLNTYSDLPKPDACTEMNQTNNTTNTNDLTNTNMHQDLCDTLSTQLNSSSPGPGSSGLGSSAEEDFLSCLSSYSDKFSASSCEEAETQNIESNILGFEKSSDPAKVKNSKPSESEDDITDKPNDLSLVDVTLQAFVQQQDSATPQSPDLKHQQLMITAEELKTEDAETQTLNISNVVYPDLLPNLSELQPKSDISSQSYHECKEQGIDEFSSSIIAFSKEVDNSPVNIQHVIIPTTPDDELCSTNQTSFIITSSPDVRRSLSDSPFESTSLGGQDANQHSPVPFGTFADFLNTNPVQDLDNNLLHTLVSDQRPNSFLQSLYASTDSQVYQICESHLSSKYISVSEPNEMLHSAHSVLCGEPSKIQMTAAAATASGLEDSPNSQRPRSQQINQTDRFEESFYGAEDNTASPDPRFIIGDDFQVLPAAQTDSYVCCNPRKISEKGVERCPQAQSVPLHRSQSEGTLIPFFDKLLLPSFGSDPSAINKSSTAQPGPELPYLSSNAPSQTPESISSPVALYSLPPLASALVRSPYSTAPDSAPKPMPQEPKQQQAANQQNR